MNLDFDTSASEEDNEIKYFLPGRFLDQYVYFAGAALVGCRVLFLSTYFILIV